MEELKKVIAANIIKLRRAHNITQAQLAQQLNYTDKAVSKWERGESIPDIFVLKSIADRFGVSVDYLLCGTHRARDDRSQRLNHAVITAISCALVFALFTIAYFVLKLSLPSPYWIWKIYICAIPICSVVLLVFNSIWGKLAWNYIIISLLLWSILLTAYIFTHLHLLFLLGLPAEIIILLWSRLKFPTKDSPGFLKPREHTGKSKKKNSAGEDTFSDNNGAENNG